MTKITNFVWNSVDDSVISEIDGAGSVQAVYTNEPQQYGGVISQRRGTTTSTYHADALGTTRALSDGTQTTTDTYLNDAWGNNVASAGTTVNPFKWVGKYGYYTDNSTGQVYVRARMYQPMVAKWMSIDPFSYIDGLNVYRVMRNRPVTLIDPSGTIPVVSCPLTCGGKKIGALEAIGPVKPSNPIPGTVPNVGFRFSIDLEIASDASASPCCCDSAQFIQIVNQNFAHESLKPPLDKPSFVDLGPVFPYYGSGPGSPAFPPPPSIFVDDFPTGIPGTLESIFKVTKVHPLKVSFEICAVCIKSKNQIFGEVPTVLQCMTWGIDYVRRSIKEPPGFEWTIEVGEFPSCQGGPSFNFETQVSKWPHNTENPVEI